MKKGKSTVLVTGATGYIGSHTIVELLEGSYEVIGIDNLANSLPEVINRIKKITKKNLKFYEIDIRDRKSLSGLFDKHNIDSVIHFAGYKAVGESVENPILYFSNNLVGTISLLEEMNEAGVKKIVFSSSCTVYGDPDSVPVKENSPINPQNPYGRTKAWIDQVLQDVSLSDSKWSVISLRYFNPIGAHSSGLIGENPTGIPNNLVPYITQTAIGRRKLLQIYGGDYPTKDGTCIRDYIHITDLAKGHVKALQKLPDVRCEYVNLGTGKGYSVLEVVNTFQEVNEVIIPYEITERRLGDASEIYADTSKAELFLNWKAEKSLADMLSDAWSFQQNNPEGYQ